jgi:YggT family protein
LILICRLLDVFLILVFARIILSYFPLQPGGAMAGIYSFVYSITEPVMGPLRRVIPPLGMFDLSPIIIIIGVQVLQRSICS